MNQKYTKADRIIVLFWFTLIYESSAFRFYFALWFRVNNNVLFYLHFNTNPYILLKKYIYICELF